MHPDEYVLQAMNTSRLARDFTVSSQELGLAPGASGIYFQGALKQYHDIQQKMLIEVGLGIAGEAGEVADLVKKTEVMGHPLDWDTYDLEVGDVLWYVAEYCKLRGTTFSELMDKNIDKLSKRYASGGFTLEESLNRSE